MPAPGQFGPTAVYETKLANLNRPSRIEGQVRALARRVEADRDCPDILLPQLAAIEEALRAAGRELLRNRLATASRMHRARAHELLDLMYRNAKGPKEQV